MSQRVARYEGEGRHRRPVYVDEGPAAPSATDGLASLGRLSAITSNDLDDGAGRRVERRQITDAEIAARADVRPAAAQATQSHRRDSARPAVLEDVDKRDSPDVPSDPPATESRDVTLVALLGAARAAAEAWDEVTTSEHLLDQARIRWDQARHALDASYRALDTPPAAIAESEHTNSPEIIPGSPQTPTSPATTTSRRPVATSSTTGSADGDMPPWQRRILDALIETNGDRVLAAEKVGYKTSSFVGSLGAIRKRPDLTDDERAALASRRK